MEKDISFNFSAREKIAYVFLVIFLISGTYFFSMFVLEKISLAFFSGNCPDCIIESCGCTCIPAADRLCNDISSPPGCSNTCPSGTQCPAGLTCTSEGCKDCLCPGEDSRECGSDVHPTFPVVCPPCATKGTSCSHIGPNYKCINDVCIDCSCTSPSTRDCNTTYVPNTGCPFCSLGTKCPPNHLCPATGLGDPCIDCSCSPASDRECGDTTPNNPGCWNCPAGYYCPNGQTCVDLSEGICKFDIANPLPWNTIGQLFTWLINMVFIFTLIIVPLMILIGGFYILTSRGDSSMVAKGKDIIFYTVIGLMIVLLSYGIVAFIKSLFGG